jgi:hypothetical protein
MESTLLWRGHPPKITVGIEVHQEVSRSTTTTTTTTACREYLLKSIFGLHDQNYTDSRTEPILVTCLVELEVPCGYQDTRNIVKEIFID